MAEVSKPPNGGAQPNTGETGIVTTGPKEPMYGDKSVSQVESETAALIAELAAEGFEDGNENDDEPSESAAKAKERARQEKAKLAAKDKAAGKDKGKGKGKDEPKTEDSESDFEPDAEPLDDAAGDDADDSEGEGDSDENEGDADESEEEEGDGKKGKEPASLAAARRELRAKTKAAEELDAANRATYAELQRIDGQVAEFARQNEAKWGKLATFGEKAKAGDKEAMAEVFKELSGRDNIHDAIRWMAGMQDVKTPEQLRIERLEKERADERAAAQQRQQEQQQAQQIAAIDSRLVESLKSTKHKLARHPEAGKLIREYAATNHVEDNPKGHAKAASAVLVELRKQRDHLNTILGGGVNPKALENQEVEEEEEDEAPLKKRPGKGSPPRSAAGRNASTNARKETTGDIIADVVKEYGFKPSIREGLRGKRIGEF
jgi:hypothetical protein